MNIASFRRWSWISLAVAAVLATAMSQRLLAQDDSSNEILLAPAAAGELKTVAVIAGANYEKLISDISFMGSLAGKPEAGQMVEGGLAFFTQGKGAGAIDKKQPWGVIVQTDGAGFLPVGCLPVTKLNDLLDVAKGYGAELKEGDEGVTELVLPQRSIYVKQESGLVFISTSAGSLARLPENAQSMLGKLVTDYDLAALISVKNVPEMYRQFAIQAMQAGVQQGMKKKDGESDEQYAARQKLAEGQMAQITRMINEIDSLQLGWAVDAQQQRTHLDFTYLFVPGSKMAQQVAAYGEPKTNFAGFYQPDAAATMTFATQADPKLIAEDLAQNEAMMQSMREQFNKSIDENGKINDPEAREALKAAASDLFDAFEATIKAGQIDGGASLHLSPDSLTFVAGVQVKDPAKLESALKKLETAAKKSPEFPGIQWNAANHAGVTFHTLTVPVPADQEAPRKMLGSELNVAVGIGPESAYLAVGRDNIDAVNKAIDASAADKGKVVPPFEFALSLAPILEVAAAQAKEGDQKEVAKTVADMLRNEAQGRDHIRAVGQIVPNGLKYRFEAEEGVLRAIGTAAAEAQRKALQAKQ